MTLNKALFSSETDLWSTPQDLFDKLDEEFHFETDVCANWDNHKCDKWFGYGVDGFLVDGLKHTWSGVCWMNPPYGREITHWVKKAYEDSRAGCNVVALLPFRPDTRWSDYIFFADEWRVIKGRLKFGDGQNSAPFASVVVVFRNKPIYNFHNQPKISRIDKTGNILN